MGKECSFMKRLIGILLFTVSAVLCISFFCACGEEYSEGLNFVLTEDGTYGVRCGRVSSSRIVIPSKRYGIPVTKVLDGFFSEVYPAHREVTVVIPEGVTEICDGAFENASCLKRVELSSTVLRIGEEAFSGSVDEVVIPADSQLEVIEKRAFHRSDITEFVAPASLRNIHEYAFYWCERLERVDLSAAAELKRLGNGCFGGTALTEVIMNEGLEELGESLFEYSPIESITLPSSIQYVGYRAFAYCDRLKSVNIPIEGELREIRTSAFEGCYSLRSIKLPKNLRHIESYAFYKSHNLVEIYDLTDRGMGKSLDPSYLGVEGSGRIQVFYNEDDECIIRRTGDGFIYYIHNGYVLAGYDGDESELTLPDKLEGKTYRIAPYAFYESSVVSVAIPNGVTSIGRYAFYDSKLQRINIPPSVDSIGENAFYTNALLRLEFERDGAWRIGGIRVEAKNISAHDVQTVYADEVWYRLDR